MKFRIFSFLIFAIAVPLRGMEQGESPHGDSELHPQTDISEDSGQPDSDLNENRDESDRDNGIPVPAINISNAPGPRNITKSDVVRFVRENSSDKEAKRISKILGGKSKGNPKRKNRRKRKSKTSKQGLTDNPMAALNAIKAEEAKISKDRKLGTSTLVKTVESLGNSEIGTIVRDFLFDTWTKNGDAFRAREARQHDVQLDIAARMALREQELEQVRATEEERGRFNVEARIGEAQENTRRAIEINRDRINLIKNHPYILVGIASGIAGGFFAAKYGIKVLFDEVQRIIGIPKLAQDSSLLTLREKISKTLGFYKEEVLNTQDLIFNKAFKRRMDTLAKSIKELVANDGYLRNLLFYGVPGTGKTLTAKTIAKNSGLHYIYFAASGLAKLSEKDALNQVAELFDFATRSPKKLAIIIDEAEALFADRSDSEAGSKLKNILTLMLSYIGTQSKDYFVIVLTNRPGDLDDAFSSRCDERIEFPAPQHQEIKSLLALYVKKFLFPKPLVKTTWYETIFGKKLQPKRISIEPNAFDNKALDSIATKIAGFVGRDISKLIISIQAEAYATPGLRITKKLIDDIVERKILEKSKVDNKFRS